MPRATALELRAPRQSLPASAALAALVVLVVGLMIVPLPTPLLDLLLASNLALSVTILLVSLHVSHALRIAAFPTLLLLTTLLRLALNVSSTRLILLQADAGEVIDAFGAFVVRGNYVVGAVIFLILTIIQFVVIAKGSERVAEVGARFTLDALPGKQLAIDAELRTGGIDPAEAKRRRALLARESQFYGAMDGAMKFVKGDVIASFLITLINILGGLAIGIGQRDMEAAAALKRYGLLTIGDGLVSQIPALVIATAAGVLVTRVASEEGETPLGEEIFRQIFGEPRAIRAAGFFVIALGVIPGLPALPFLVIGTLLTGAGYAGLRARAAEARTRAPLRARRARSGRERYAPGVVPWSIQVSDDLASTLADQIRGSAVVRTGLRSVATELADRLFHDLGVPLPACDVAVTSALEPRTAALLLHEMEAHRFRVPEGESDVAALATEAFYPVLERRAHEFLGVSETQALLSELEAEAPASVHEVVPKLLSVAALADVLRRLVEEGVSVRDLSAILEALAAIAQADKDPANLTEYVRSKLRRTISHALTAGASEIDVYLLDPSIEEAVRSAVSHSTAGSFLALAPAAGRDIVHAVEHALGAASPPEGRPLVVLTQPDIRRFVRKLVEVDLPSLKVVSFAELQPEIRVRPIASVTLG